MRRRQRQDTTTPGNDSFLDVVANIVGILIILVVVAGLRTRNAAVEAASSDGTIRQEMKTLEQEQATARSLRGEILQTEARVQDLSRERMVRQKERDRLAIAVAAWEQRIQSRRGQLDREGQKAYDLGMELSKAGAELQEIRRKLDRAEAAEAAPIRIESYPTPLARPVDQKEVHFQLRSGRLAFIPLEKLLERLKARAREKASRLLSQSELTDTVGPEGGFRLRYKLERQELTERTRDGSLRIGSYARLTEWTLLPVSGELGEPVDAALAGGSRFRQVVAGLDPQETTITIWTYPDSFAEFRRLKKDLFERGFATAGRPLPHGVPIGGSPEGTKSAAE
jgi:hypothetical protein